MRKHLTVLILILFVAAAPVRAEPVRVLWWDISLDEPRNKPANRRQMARCVDGYKGGNR